MIIIPILLVILGTIIGSFGALMLKLGSSVRESNLLKNWRLILGVLLYGLSTVPFVIAVMQAPLSIIYPITSVSYIWTMLLSSRFLGEKMNAWKYASMIVIILGVILITTS